MTSKGSILITGATSGFGKHITGLLAQRGRVVLAGYRKDEDKADLMSIGTNVIPLQIDVTSRESILHAKEYVLHCGYPLYAVINNAGIAFGGAIETISLENFKSVFEVNYFGAISMVQEFLPLLRTTKGRLVFMGSVAGFIAVPFLQPYVASKFSLRALADGLSLELEGQGVHISLIEPGPFKTPLRKKSLYVSRQDGLQTSGPYSKQLEATDKTIKKYYCFFAPVHRINATVLHAIEAVRPKRHYLVYTGTFLDQVLFKRTPSWLKRIVLSRATGMNNRY